MVEGVPHPYPPIFGCWFGVYMSSSAFMPVSVPLRVPRAYRAALFSQSLVGEGWPVVNSLLAQARNGASFTPPGFTSTVRGRELTPVPQFTPRGSEGAP